MALPAIIGALGKAVGGKVAATAKSYASKEGIKSLIKSGISGSGSSTEAPIGGVYSIPALPNMDGGFYGHVKAGSWKSVPMKGQMDKTVAKPDSCSTGLSSVKGR